MAKLPAIQFYPGDWRKDVGVQSLTFHDRGIWFEILMLMHESERRGVLTLNGAPMPDDSLCRLLGLDNQSLTKALTNLLTSGVASREQDSGALMCRRMVRDENLRKVRTECGKLGGNPVLDKQKPTTGDKQKPTPSSSSSTSYSKPLKTNTARAMSDPEVVSMLQRIVISHPRSLERHLSMDEVSAAERVAVMAAGKYEADKAGTSIMGALEMILGMVQDQANESPPGVYHFYKSVVPYFAAYDYRTKPRTNGGSNGKSKSEQTIDAGRDFLKGLADRLGVSENGNPPPSSEVGGSGVRRLR